MFHIERINYRPNGKTGTGTFEGCPVTFANNNIAFGLWPHVEERIIPVELYQAAVTDYEERAEIKHQTRNK